MDWAIIISVITTILLLQEGYRAGETRTMGGFGGVILVLLFSLIGLIFVYFSPKVEETKEG